MWRPRDRERFIGSYDPEHEMPDADRERGDRWQSDAYRRNARDTRFAYRMNPDRFEGRFEGRRDVGHEAEMRWNRDGRDDDRDRNWGRAPYDRNFDRGGYGGAYERDYGSDRYEGDRYGGGRDRERDRGGFMSGPRFDRHSSDRGWDHGGTYAGDRDRWASDRDMNDRWHAERERDRDWRRR